MLNEFKYPSWQRPLEDALIEFDVEKLRVKLEALEGIIFDRLLRIAGEPGHEEEYEAIKAEAAVIRDLQSDRLGFPKIQSTRD